MTSLKNILQNKHPSSPSNACWRELSRSSSSGTPSCKTPAPRNSTSGTSWSRTRPRCGASSSPSLRSPTKTSKTYSTITQTTTTAGKPGPPSLRFGRMKPSSTRRLMMQTAAKTSPRSRLWAHMRACSMLLLELIKKMIGNGKKT